MAQASAPSSDPPARTPRPPWASMRRPTHGDTMPDANKPQVKLPKRMTSLVCSASRIGAPSTPIP